MSTATAAAPGQAAPGMPDLYLNASAIGQVLTCQPSRVARLADEGLLRWRRLPGATRRVYSLIDAMHLAGRETAEARPA